MADLFVSYSRKDKEFVRHLVEGLVGREKEVWVDWEDIAPTAEWMSEIELGIDASDSFAFVISPDSLTSGTCARELERARTQGKRIVPLLHREPNGASVPAELASRNWIYFRSSDDFDQSLETCVGALETNLDWVRFHTRLIVRAQEWDAGGRDRSRLLSGTDLRAAESELAAAGPELEPQPTPLQREYVLASRRAHSRRQRVVLASVSVALVLTVVLALLAWVQRDRAISNERTASSRELATAATGVIERDPELSVLLAREAIGRKRTDEAEEALRRALSLSHAISTTERHGWITTASFDANGERVLAASRDGTAFIAASDDGRTETTLNGPPRPGGIGCVQPGRAARRDSEHRRHRARLGRRDRSRTDRPHRSRGQGLASRLQRRRTVDRDREQRWNGAHLGRGDRTAAPRAPAPGLGLPRRASPRTAARS